MIDGCIHLAFREAPIVERRDVSYNRRSVQEKPVNVWHEPDSKPVFTFMLRPRLIQEGISCKLICCVDGKPQPKVNDSECLFYYVRKSFFQ